MVEESRDKVLADQSHDHGEGAEREPVGVGQELGEVEHLTTTEAKNGAQDETDQRAVGVDLLAVDDQQQLREEQRVDEVGGEHPQLVHALGGDGQNGAQHADDDHRDTRHHRDLLLRRLGVEQGLVHVDGEHGGRGQVGAISGGQRGSSNAAQTHVGNHLRGQVLDDVGQREGLLALHRTHLGVLAPVHSRSVNAHQRRRNSAKQSAHTGPVGHDLGVLHGAAGEDALEVHLPGDASEDHQQSGVSPDSGVLTRNAAQPVSRVLGNVADSVVRGHEGNADEQADEHNHQLHDIRVGNGVHAADEGEEAGAHGTDENSHHRVHANQDGEASAQSRERHANPEHISQTSGQVQESDHPLLQLLGEGVEHGHVLLGTHLISEDDGAEEEAHGIAPGSLRPSQTRTLRHDSLRGTVEVASAHPRSDHRNNTHQTTEVSSGKSQLHGRIGLLLLAGPHTNTEHDRVENQKGNHTDNIEMVLVGSGGNRHGSHLIADSKSKQGQSHRNRFHFCSFQELYGWQQEAWALIGKMIRTHATFNPISTFPCCESLLETRCSLQQTRGFTF